MLKFVYRKARTAERFDESPARLPGGTNEGVPHPLTNGRTVSAAVISSSARSMLHGT
jgi:hypothetical protein